MRACRPAHLPVDLRRRRPQRALQPLRLPGPRPERAAGAAAAVQVVNNSTGKCLAVDAAGTGNGVPIVQQTCASGSAAQRFTFVPTDAGYYRIVSQLSGRVVDIAGVSAAQGAKTIQWDYLGGRNQQWKPAAQGYGGWTFVARHTS
ncbi:RICIN domain-containing protein [Dactylosporangium sp. NPDC049742]|uniref:RICIN domain-containing protein n=1 Tax=Dactylosporangium sp. NPDC049742 TaxID=3154737 RepID=UPI003425A211